MTDKYSLEWDRAGGGVEHRHSTNVEGCYRCELSQDEVIPNLVAQIEDFTRATDNTRALLNHLLDDLAYHSKREGDELQVRTLGGWDYVYDRLHTVLAALDDA